MADDPLSQRFSRKFPRGTILFREGDPGREMFVVQAGRVTITKRVGEVEMVLSTLGQGEFLGEMSILNNKPRSATATVSEDAQLLVIDSRTFEAMIRGNAEIAIRMIKKLADRLQDADAQIENLLHRDATSRVVHWLVLQAARAGAEGPQSLAIGAADLPAHVGVPAAQVEEVLDRLEKARLVRRAAGGLEVAEVAKLRHFLEFLQMKAGLGDAA
ncbi:MAG TPA: Crp/Fnr family transcriptional regulator [Anaeromyxobacteraceae bacterium]|nr:Crp/Fnr family transcriptional regulator [Anaeromyxobacteraceae bacterium]